MKKRKRWIYLINRINPDKTEWEATNSDRVCSVHFVDKIPTVQNPDPVLNLGNKRILFKDPLPSRSLKTKDASRAQTEQQATPHRVIAPLDLGRGKILFSDQLPSISSKTKDNALISHVELIAPDVTKPFAESLSSSSLKKKEPTISHSFLVDHTYCNIKNLQPENQNTEVPSNFSRVNSMKRTNSDKAFRLKAKKNFGNIYFASKTQIVNNHDQSFSIENKTQPARKILLRDPSSISNSSQFQSDIEEVIPHPFPVDHAYYCRKKAFWLKDKKYNLLRNMSHHYL